jgi:hypothetical protein
MLRIKNWDRFQHYTKRNPPWIKLHRDLLDNQAWGTLSGDASKLLVECWLIASQQTESGVIALSLDELAWRLRRDLPQLGSILQELVNSGLVEDASNALAPCKQSATPETEEETEEVTDSDANASGASAASKSTDVEKPADKPETLHGHFMPMLRSAGFEADDRDGSILKALEKKGYRWGDIEGAIWGLSYARDTGILEAGYGLAKDDPLTLRILYAKNKSTGAPIWTDAVDVWYPKHLQRERSKRKKSFGIGLDDINRAIA